MEKTKPTRLRFTYEDDLVLLREFLNINPILNAGGWELIKRNVSITTGKLFLMKTLKQHLQLLLELFRKKVIVDQVRSGIEEPYCEKNVLLQEVSSLCQEYNYDFKEKHKSVTKEQRTNQLGKRNREECAQTYVSLQESEVIIEDLTEEVTPLPIDHNYCGNVEVPKQVHVDSHDEQQMMTEDLHKHPVQTPAPLQSLACSTPSTSKGTNVPRSDKKVLGPLRSRVKRGEPLKKNALLYLTEKNDRDNKIRLRELDLEERKVNIEERKVYLKEQELKLTEKYMEEHHKEVMMKLEMTKKRADVEVEEKKITNQLLQSQQKLIDQLLQRE